MIPNVKKIIDISPRLSADLPVFPGDVSFQRKVSMDFTKGDHLGLSSIECTLHIGAHTDAPNHYHRDGVGIDQRNLDFYIGAVTVVDLSEMDGLVIDVKHLPNQLKLAPRVLFKTNSFPHMGPWTNDFVSLSESLLEYLKDQNVKTVGIDTPSVDAANSKELENHNKIYEFDMAIIEGVDLTDVQQGDYFLLATPLKIADGDASPVRALLLEF